MDIGAAIFFTDYSMGPAALGRALEERGFGSLWAPEHSHIPLSRRTPFPQGGELPKKYYDVMDPFVTLAAAATATTRLQLATGVCLVVQRDPIQTAKQVASLDQISGGRFLFGIGAGWNAEEMADHGTEFKTRFDVMRERVEAMKAIWTRSKPEYHGTFVDFPPMMTWPKPVQKPHPPVLVGGAFPYGARRAIAFGEGWVPHARRPAYGDVLGLLPDFRKLAVEAGRDPATLPITIFGVPEDRDLVARYRDAGVARVVFNLPPAKGGESNRIRRSTPTRSSDCRARESGRSMRSSSPVNTVTTNRDASRPAAVCSSRARWTSAPSCGWKACVLKPSACRPAMAAIRGPKPPTMIGGGGSGRRKPDAPAHSRRMSVMASTTRCARTASPSTDWPMAVCSTAYGVRRLPPAPSPRSNRPPETV